MTFSYLRRYFFCSKGDDEDDAYYGAELDGPNEPGTRANILFRVPCLGSKYTFVLEHLFVVHYPYLPVRSCASYSEMVQYLEEERIES